MLYEMPAVELGMPVYWFPDGDQSQQPFAGFVTKVGHDNVCVNILMPDSYNMRIKDGVRHMSDPLVRRKETQDAGGWDYQEWYKRIIDFLPRQAKPSPASPSARVFQDRPPAPPPQAMANV